MTTLSPRLWRWRWRVLLLICLFFFCGHLFRLPAVRDVLDAAILLLVGFPFETGENQLVRSCTRYSRRHQTSDSDSRKQ